MTKQAGKDGQPLRIAIFGTGYWARFQIAAWQSMGALIVAAWNRTRSKAQAIADEFAIPAVYETPEEVFEQADFDLADIIADVGAHAWLVGLAARYDKDVICQKPMAASWQDCVSMVGQCRRAGIWFAVHENFRYQPPFEQTRQLLASGELGDVLHAHIQLKSPDRAIIGKQPALAAMDHMALRDMGPHLFDLCRALFGEIRSIYSRPMVSYADLGVQDSSQNLLEMQQGQTVVCSLLHHFSDKIFIHCSRGFLILDRENRLHIENGNKREAIDTRNWPVLDYIPPDDWKIHGGHVFAAIPRCLEALQRQYRLSRPAETSGDDNLQTMRAVFAAIRSQAENRVVRLSELETEWRQPECKV